MCTDSYWYAWIFTSILKSKSTKLYIYGPFIDQQPRSRSVLYWSVVGEAWQPESECAALEVDEYGTSPFFSQIRDRLSDLKGESVHLQQVWQEQKIRLDQMLEFQLFLRDAKNVDAMSSAHEVCVCVLCGCVWYFMCCVVCMCVCAWCALCVFCCVHMFVSLCCVHVCVCDVNVYIVYMCVCVCVLCVCVCKVMSIKPIHTYRVNYRLSGTIDHWTSTYLCFNQMEKYAS